MNSRKRTCADSLQAMTRGLVWYYRRATWRNRYLPDFIVIGAQRSGTSSLFAYLAQHPQLIPSYRKEVHFFDGGLDHRVDTYQKGPAWYRAHFARQRAGATRKAFEASPFYMPHPLVPQRIARLMPDVKLIAILRNPTERAISHYFFSRELGHEPLSITDALREEEQRIEPVLRNQDYRSEAFIYHYYTNIADVTVNNWSVSGSISPGTESSYWPVRSCSVIPQYRCGGCSVSSESIRTFA